MYRTVPKSSACLDPVHMTRIPSCTLSFDNLDDGVVLQASMGFLTWYYYMIRNALIKCSLKCFLTYVVSRSMRHELNYICMYLFHLFGFDMNTIPELDAVEDVVDHVAVGGQLLEECPEAPCNYMQEKATVCIYGARSTQVNRRLLPCIL